MKNTIYYKAITNENGQTILTPMQKKAKRADDIAMGAELRKVREEKGIRQKDLAAMMRIAPSTLCKMEKGGHICINTLKRIYRKMGVEYTLTCTKAVAVPAVETNSAA